MIWKWLKIVGKAVVEGAKFVAPHITYLSEAALAIVDGNSALATQREDIQLAQLKLQYIQHEENLDFQAEQGRLSHERANELTAFIQRAEDARLQNILDFQRWALEQEKALQLQLLELNHQLQRELVSYQRQTSIKVVEEQKRLENSPIWLVASDILNSSPGEAIIPLRVFFAPPKLQFERFKAVNAAKGFPDIELTLAEGLRQFFRNYSNNGRDIDFLAGAWVSKSFHSEASIKALFGVLKSEPTLVLESEVDGDYLNFRIAYWGLNWSKYRYDPVISRLPYRDILYEAAKTRARKWTETRAKLIAAGVSPEEVDQVYGQDNVKNLEILQREQRFREAGIDVGDLELNYIINKKDFEELCQFLIIYHCVFAGLVADEYFLFQKNLPPLLPKLLSGLTQNVPDEEVVQEIIQAVILYYQNIYQALGNTQSSWVPELALDLAQSLAHLANKSWAKEQIARSVKSWLQLRNLLQPDGFDILVEAIKSALTIDDREYVEKLNQCLAAIGYDRRLSVMEGCYHRGMSRCHQGDYQAAILDFDQAIQLNSGWAEAYYNRGLAYAKLEQYQKAIEDYTQAIEISDKWADAYNNRGNAYYKLGHHEKAIADYDRALSINPNFSEAARNRDIAQGVLEELKRKKEERKHRLENFDIAYTLTGHSSFVTSVVISPDGQILASSSWDKTIKLWQLSTGREIRTLTGHSQQVHSVAISPDGQTLASGSWDDTIKLWQLSTGQKIRTLSGHSNDIRCVIISPDGQIIASASEDKTIKIWQVETGKEIRILTGHSGWVHSLAISPDGQTIVSCSSDETIKIWQVETGKELQTLRSHSESVLCLAITPDGQMLASGSDDNTIKLWNMSTGKELDTLAGHSRSVNSLAISPDGQMLVSGSDDNTIKIWQLRTGKELGTLMGHSSKVNSLAISPDGKTLVSGSNDKTIKIWRAQ
ncbi:MAG: tetratricopeptide repeat protein [Aphanothece sp. CMT-3BRIN-NPC111]|jgi:WD40 repeat protein|nr:tetratricopeptide repeat protein [Aphanothece sp. CMT-3BRIN-NPC111]